MPFILPYIYFHMQNNKIHPNSSDSFLWLALLYIIIYVNCCTEKHVDMNI